MKGGVFELDAPFLTASEVVTAVQLACVALGAPVGHRGEFSLTTLKNLHRRGLFSTYAARPDLRNHLYSAIDVVRLATISYVSNFGMPIEVGSGVGEAIVEILKGPGFGHQDDDLAVLFVRMERGEQNESNYTIHKPDYEGPGGADPQAFFSRRAPAALIVHWGRIATIASETAHAYWFDKAKKLKNKLEAMLPK